MKGEVKTGNIKSRECTEWVGKTNAKILQYMLTAKNLQLRQ